MNYLASQMPTKEELSQYNWRLIVDEDSGDYFVSTSRDGYAMVWYDESITIYGWRPCTMNELVNKVENGDELVTAIESGDYYQGLPVSADNKSNEIDDQIIFDGGKIKVEDDRFPKLTLSPRTLCALLGVASQQTTAQCGADSRYEGDIAFMVYRDLTNYMAEANDNNFELDGSTLGDMIIAACQNCHPNEDCDYLADFDDFVESL